MPLARSSGVRKRESEHAIDVSGPGVVDARIATLRCSFTHVYAQLLLGPRLARSSDLEDQRLQLAELARPLLRVRGADALEREEELAQETQ